jgi:hypothetical protein
MDKEPRPRRKTRTNAEILADMRAKAAAQQVVVPARGKRRTKAQIEADKLAADRRRQELAEEAARHIPAPPKTVFDKTIHFLTDGTTFAGKVWLRGEEVRIREGSREFELAFDLLGNFAFGKSAEEQLAAWGEVRYGEGPWPYEQLDPETAEWTDDNGNTTPFSDEEKAQLRKSLAARGRI